MPTEMAATWSRTGLSGSLPACTSFAQASCSATQAPVIEAQRVPPSACSTSQSSVIWRSPSALRSVTARSAAADQALDFLGAAGLLALGRLARGAGVGRARQHAVFGGDPALALAAQEGRHVFLDAGGAQHRVSPISISTEPSAWRVKLRVRRTGRSWSDWRWLGRMRYCPCCLGLNLSMVERISSIACSISSSESSVLCAGSRPNSSICVAISSSAMVWVEILLLASSR